MRFCPNILWDLNFEPTALQPCCNVRQIGIPAFPYVGGPIDMVAYNAHIRNILQKIQQNPPAVCAPCPELRENVILEVNLADVQCTFRTLSFNQHRFHCNCRCVYCDLWKQTHKTKPYDITPALQSLMKQDALTPKCAISWGGGEPTLLPEFEKAARWIAENGFFQQIYTNAIIYSKWVEVILASGVGRIDVSLDSGGPQLHTRVKGKDVWEKVMYSLHRYRSAAQHPSQIELKYIIFDMTNEKKDIDAFFKLCTQLEITTVCYSFDFREVNSNRVSEQSLNAAVRFRHWAKTLGMICQPFFVDSALLQKIEHLEQTGA
ncbi:MAG: radical SAM protein [Desulfovibrio sp.]|nr:radical SAM protein [Desulfovibrio sp.]